MPTAGHLTQGMPLFTSHISHKQVVLLEFRCKIFSNAKKVTPGLFSSASLWVPGWGTHLLTAQENTGGDWFYLHRDVTHLGLIPGLLLLLLVQLEFVFLLGGPKGRADESLAAGWPVAQTSENPCYLRTQNRRR